VTSDPIGLRGGVNLYSYVFNNPLGYIDPYGLFGLDGMVHGITGMTPDQIPTTHAEADYNSNPQYTFSNEKLVNDLIATAGLAAAGAAICLAGPEALAFATIATLADIYGFSNSIYSNRNSTEIIRPSVEATMQVTPVVTGLTKMNRLSAAITAVNAIYTMSNTDCSCDHK
jgi:uncharacterized protein RhaS with RHS repeats